MLHNFWKKLHLTLALVVSLFLIIASVTGAILSFEPIEQQSHSYYVDRPEEISVIDLIKTLDSTYNEVDFVEGEMSESGFFLLTIIDEEGEMHKFYIDPRTGKKLGTVTKPSPTFNWNRKLHRSLFMGTAGRLTMGIVAAILFLMAITGIVLVFKRQLKFWKYFGRITKDGTFSFLHIALGRWAFPLLMIVSITGTYLSLDRFGYLPKEKKAFHNIDTENLADSPEIEKYEFSVFKKTSLDQVQKIQFPFTPFPEDYYQLKLKDRDIIVNQYTGNIESTQYLGTIKGWNELIFNLHTGKGSVGWSLVLLFASISILFFIFSGFAIAIKRIGSKTKNKVSKASAEIVLLYGSESGQTGNYVRHVQKVMRKNNVLVFADTLNNYSEYPEMKHLIILTSTYGNGEAPSNARHFLKKFASFSQSQEFQFSVVGFGSTDYPDFCKFANQVQKALTNNGRATELIPLVKVNKQSNAQKTQWLSEISNHLNIQISKEEMTDKRQTHSFKVTSISIPSNDTNQHFRISLQSPIQTFQSGDLLAILPEGESEERFYSIGKTDETTISLSIKKHDKGICSNYLASLKAGEMLEARIQSNPEFHLNQSASFIYCIANGTGIAPLLGMIAQNNSETESTLVWGVKNTQISDLYKEELSHFNVSQRLSKSSILYSDEENLPKTYVQDYILNDANRITTVLQSNGIIYICGSIAMRDGVLATISQILKEQTDLSLEHFIESGQILSDCY